MMTKHKRRHIVIVAGGFGGMISGPVEGNSKLYTSYFHRSASGCVAEGTRSAGVGDNAQNSPTPEASEEQALSSRF